MVWDNICGGRALRIAVGIAAPGEDDGSSVSYVQAKLCAK